MEDDDVIRLRRAINILARQLNTSATDEGLTPTQASVLGLVVRNGPCSPSDLARLEHVNPTMLSRVVGKLEDDGLISRTPHPDDLRSASIAITPEGRRVHGRIKTQRAAVVARGVEALTPRAQATLARALPALEQLADHLASAD